MQWIEELSQIDIRLIIRNFIYGFDLKNYSPSNGNYCREITSPASTAFAAPF
jgi:hypothetical protein